MLLSKKTIILAFAIFALSGCSTTVKWLDRQVQKSHIQRLGPEIKPKMFTPKIVKLNDTRSQELKNWDREFSEFQASSPSSDFSVYSVDPISGQVLKIGEVTSDYPVGYLP